MQFSVSWLWNLAHSACAVWCFQLMQFDECCLWILVHAAYAFWCMLPVNFGAYCLCILVHATCPFWRVLPMHFGVCYLCNLAHIEPYLFKFGTSRRKTWHIAFFFLLYLTNLWRNQLWLSFSENFECLSFVRWHISNLDRYQGCWRISVSVGHTSICSEVWTGVKIIKASSNFSAEL